MKQHGKKLLALSLALALVLGAVLGISAPIVQAAEPAGNVEINEVNFPDANFRAYVQTLPGAEDNVFTPEELAGITEIDCSGYDKTENEKISDLTGIEHFTALTDLNCRMNKLTKLDVRHNKALTTLCCEINHLASLDVSENTALERLECSENHLTSLDLSHNSALTGLECQYNRLTSLDLSHNPALQALFCDYNKLTSLNVSQNLALTDLECSENQLTSLDVSKNSALVELFCSKNQLTNLDVSQNTAMGRLFCGHNRLTSLDVSQNTSLNELHCGDNQLISLDLSENTNAWLVGCNRNQRFVEEGSNLLDLDANFDINKVSDLEGGSFEGGKVHFTADQLTYSYDLGSEEVSPKRFTMIGNDHKPEKYENPFTDLKKDEYYVTPILWAVNKGITIGTTTTTFEPDSTCTRGQIVTFLHRNAGCPYVDVAGQKNPFVDVSDRGNYRMYYHDPVLWAMSRCITAGTSKTTFSPNQGCTRAQVATFLWRAAGQPAPQNSENPFTDVPANEYYYNAVLWAVEKGITVGTSKTEFSPDEVCTRAQIVTFLYRSEH